MNWKIIAGGLIVAGIVFMQTPFAKEWKAYGKVKDYYDCCYFLNDYPDGWHAEEITFKKIGLCPSARSQMGDISDYLDSYPNGKYVEEVNALYDELWNDELQKYNSRDNSNLPIEARRYMSELLQYLKSRRSSTVQVSVSPNLQLKDYSDYPISVREDLESIYSDESLPLKGNVASLKSNFTGSDLYALQGIFVNGLQKSFDSMFMPGFINVVNGAEPIDGAPILAFNYTIKSQEDDVLNTLYPHIWVYSQTETYTRRERILMYLIGITINFNVAFTIPNSDTYYNYSERGEPENDIDNINDINDGYRKMTQACFLQFSNKMSYNLGLIID